jgi:two-component system OmpR family sensor kinase
VKRLGLRARLAIWHGVAVAVILSGAALAGDRLLSHMVLGQLDAALLALAETEAAAGLSGSGEELRLHPTAWAPPEASWNSLDTLVQALDAEGRILRPDALAGAALPVDPPLLAQLREGEVVVETIPAVGGEPLRMVSLPIEIDGTFRYAVQVATPLRPTLAFLRSARLLVLGGALTMLCAVAAIGVLLTQRALRPFDRMVAEARGIGRSDLHARLPAPGVADELGRLATALNEMLDRIEQAVDSQRRFTADASHEMRSPLSRLRSELDVTLRRPRTPEEYEEVLRSALQETERLSRLTGELLTLARLDAGEMPDRSEAPVALLPLIEEEVRRLKPEADAREIQLRVAGPPDLAVKGGPETLRLVVANLLQNAVKFTPARGEVLASVSAHEQEVVLAVSDTGPGICPEDVPRIFDRFYRGSVSRSPDSPGVGLGLAITRAIVQAHGGSIAVDSGHTGATFLVRLPLAA